MRIKKFTLLLMAVLFSAVGFAQKSFPVGKDISFSRQAQVQTLVKQNRIGSAIALSPKSEAAKTASEKAPAKAPEVVTPPADGEVEYYTLTGTNSKDGATTRQIKLVWDDEDDDVFYVSGLSYYLPNAYVKGTFVSDETVVFAAGQYMGNVGIDIYFGGYGDAVLADVEATYDGNKNSFTFSGYLLDNGDPETIGYYAYWEPGVVLTPIEGTPEIPVVIPNNLQIETYAFSALDYFENNTDVSGTLNIGIYGQDVYIQGMSVDYPEAWIKGTFKDDQTVVFPSGQLLTDERSLYFIAIDDNFDVVESYTLIYDPQTGNFEEGPEAPMINTYKDKISYSVWQFYYGYEIKKITEKAATPAKSLVKGINYKVTGDDVLEFVLSSVDENNEGLVEEKVAYKLWYVTEDGEEKAFTFSPSLYSNLTAETQEIPATFTDGADFLKGNVNLRSEDHTSWQKIGIQGVYYGGEERHASEIAWYTPSWPIITTLPEGLTVTEHTFKGVTSRDAAVERIVGLALQGDDMYIRGLGSTNEEKWVKGTKNADGAYVFPKGQDLGDYYDEDRLFFLGYSDNVFTDPVLRVNAASGVYEFTTDIIENADYTDRSYYVEWINAGATITIDEAEQEIPTLIELPEGLVPEAWTFSGKDYFEDDADVAYNVNVCFDGTDVYVQGISQAVPEAWILGSLEDNKITFASGQYLGGDDELWFIGYNMNSGIADYVMTYDAENFTMSNGSSNELIGVNAYKDKINRSLYEFYHTNKIKKITEKAATPATPSITTIAWYRSGPVAEFNIPTIDVDGDGIVTDKLSYKLYYDNGDGEAQPITFTTELYEKIEADMTEVPYGFTEEYDFYTDGVYLNMEEFLNWTRIGIQSIYTGGDETHESEIGWYTILRPFSVSLPEGAEVANYEFSGTDSDGAFTRTVKVAKVDDYVYIQGASTVDAESWIAGVKNPDTNVYTFPNGQYLGTYVNEARQTSYYIFLMGYNRTLGVMNFRMNYDEETGIFTTANIMVENANYVDNLYYLNQIQAGATLTPGGDDNAVTSISAAAAEDGVAYNLAGQRIDKNFKGIIVMNGKKFLKK